MIQKIHRYIYLTTIRCHNMLNTACSSVISKTLDNNLLFPTSVLVNMKYFVEAQERSSKVTLVYNYSLFITFLVQYIWKLHIILQTSVTISITLCILEAFYFFISFKLILEVLHICSGISVLSNIFVILTSFFFNRTCKSSDTLRKALSNSHLITVLTLAWYLFTNKQLELI